MKIKKIAGIILLTAMLTGGPAAFAAGEIQSGAAASIAPEGSKETETEDTIYGIGSVSKVFAAAAVMQLSEKGKLELDAPLVRYLPEFVMSDSRYAQITPRMLLDHSAGLMGTSDHNAMLLGELNTYAHDTLLAQLKAQRLKATPGAFSVYSNDGFTLTELLVERVSGMSFTDYVEKSISSPLNMKNTKTPNSDFDRSRQAKGYYSGSNLELPPEYLNEIGAGGILSTAEDLCLFAQIFMEKGTAVLSGESASEMAKAQTNNPLFSLKGDKGFEYGLGWDSVNTYPFSRYGIKAVSKGGDSKVYHGNLTVLPEKNMAAAVLSSGGESTLDQIMVNEMLLAALSEFESVKGLDAVELPELVTGTNAAKAFEKYEGLYVSDGLLKVRFSKEGLLYISTTDKRHNVTQEYQSAENGQFVSLNGNYISSAGELMSAEGGTKGKTILSFQTGSNGLQYLSIVTSESRPGMGESVSGIPFAQKVSENKLSVDTAAMWQERNGKRYYFIGEKASSSAYLEPETTVRMPKEGGYFRNARIVDSQYARAFVELPIMLGRDLIDYRFYEEGGKDYLVMQNGGDEPIAVKRK